MIDLRSSFAIILFSLLSFSGSSQDTFRIESVRPKLGTEFRIVVYSTDTTRAKVTIDSAWSLCDRLNDIFSDYKMDSEVVRLSAQSGTGSHTLVSDHLWNVLVFAQNLSVESDGSFDLTIGPLSKLWRRAIRRNEMPDSLRIASARNRVGYHMLKLDSIGKSVFLERPLMRLDLGAIAKGYIVDEMYNFMSSHGESICLIDGGGDLYAGQSPPGQEGWSVQIGKEGPIRYIENQAIASSGDSYKYIIHNGKRYSHIVNPKTGYGVVDKKTVHVIARNCMAADALSSTCSIIEKNECEMLASRYDADLFIPQ